MILSYPLLLLAFSLAILSFAAWLGATQFRSLREQAASNSTEFGVIQGATLTLLGLLIGFTFSMALGRYDQRKNYEEEEANAIGTEYLRADFLPAADAARVRSLLREYLDQRILHYSTRDGDTLAKIDTHTAELQSALWNAVRVPAQSQPTPLSALVAAGMNDVINTQGYTQAAWLNRIPVAAWILMLVVAFYTTMLIGIGLHRHNRMSVMMLILPVLVSIAFFLIADIDSPRRGVIRVVPQNLLMLADSLRPG